MRRKDITLRKKIRHKQSAKCKYCGNTITDENRYGQTVCTSCIWKHLKVCNDDCFNCKYPDCVMNHPTRLRDDLEVFFKDSA